MDKDNEEHPASVPGRGFASAQRNGKPRKADDVVTGAKVCVVDDGLGWEIYEQKRPVDGLLCWYLLLNEGVHAA